MAWYRQIWNVLRPGRTQRNLERELSFHVRERADELQAAGMSEDEAVRDARRLFGNYTSQVERTREMDINGWLDSALRNLRLAVRALVKTPAFTTVVILTLALGIGANSAVFSAIDAILLKPLPFPEGDQLVKIGQANRNAKTPQTSVAPVRLEDWNRMNTTFQAMTGYYTESASETTGDLPEK